MKENSQLHNIYLTAYRPWRSYTVLEDTPVYKIRCIEVEAGKCMSLQKSYQRNEHWIIVSSTATVTVGEETKIVHTNESIYIRMARFTVFTIKCYSDRAHRNTG